MAITKEYARGTIIAVQARATISVGDPALLEYSWFKDGELQSTIQTGETARRPESSQRAQVRRRRAGSEART